VNALVLVPHFIYSNKYKIFAAAHITILAAFAFANYSLFSLESHDFPPPFIVPFFPYLLILACSTAYKIVRDKFLSDQLAKEKENENLKTELQLLRSQVSPHFMFNVLNNIASMARFKSEELEPTVVKLSSLMRYMLYDADEEKVALSKEIEYLRSYIDLQRQRYEDIVEVNVSVKVPDQQYRIEPMLLIPFVENAFKHGTGYMDKAEINILLMLDKEELYLNVLNRYDPQSLEVKDKASGIGLANVKRRLKLLYENAHQLTITRHNGWFNVFLTIKLTA
jgi:LytS/YehU family sensor histidine kinase